VAFHRHMDAWFRERGIASPASTTAPTIPTGVLEKYAFACGCRKPEPACSCAPRRTWTLTSPAPG